MDRTKRPERLSVVTAKLIGMPSRPFTLSDLSADFGVARSTLSEDLSTIREALERHDLGTIDSVPGPQGGVRYRTALTSFSIKGIVGSLCGELSRPDRILRGGFLYMTDVLLDPYWTCLIGRVLATAFGSQKIDFAVTVETKGIPVSLMTAHFLGVPLVVSRRDHKVTEGPAVSINYFSGSNDRIQTMSLARRALPPQSRVLLIDDFMRAGGTARGMIDLMAEFGAQVVGVAVVVETASPRRKLVSDYVSLAILEGIEEHKREVRISPSPWVDRLDAAGRSRDGDEL